MIALLRKFFGHILTDSNEDFDPILSGFVLSLTAGIGLTVFTVVWRNAEFHGQDFGIMVGAIAAAFGLGYGLKKNMGDKPNVGEKDNGSL